MPRDLDNKRRAWREWYHRNKADQSKKIYFNRTARRAKLMAWLRAFKQSAFCVRCGFSGHPEALDFHHVIGADKDFSIGEAIVKTQSIKRLQKEIAKCEVLCANCHRREPSGKAPVLGTGNRVFDSPIPDQLRRCRHVIGRPIALSRSNTHYYNLCPWWKEIGEDGYCDFHRPSVNWRGGHKCIPPGEFWSRRGRVVRKPRFPSGWKCWGRGPSRDMKRIWERKIRAKLRVEMVRRPDDPELFDADKWLQGQYQWWF